jgi:hypothetical protein
MFGFADGRNLDDALSRAVLSRYLGSLWETPQLAFPVWSLGIPSGLLGLAGLGLGSPVIVTQQQLGFGPTCRKS